MKFKIIMKFYKLSLLIATNNVNQQTGLPFLLVFTLLA